MFNIDHMSRSPVYEQLIEQVEKYITIGLLKPLDKLPSVRTLSVDLSVNPNTVQKALAYLDSCGVINSVPGKGCFVAEDAPTLVNQKVRKRLSELPPLLSELKSAGIKKQEVDSIVTSIFNKSPVYSIMKEECRDDNC